MRCSKGYHYRHPYLTLTLTFSAIWSIHIFNPPPPPSKKKKKKGTEQTLLTPRTLLHIYQGSGKTLAFGLPILTHILQRKASHLETDGTNKSGGNDIAKTSVADDSTASRQSDKIRKPLLSLIMTPTRELALQIRNHLQQAAKHTSLEVQV